MSEVLTNKQYREVLRSQDKEIKEIRGQLETDIKRLKSRLETEERHCKYLNKVNDRLNDLNTSHEITIKYLSGGEGKLDKYVREEGVYARHIRCLNTKVHAISDPTLNFCYRLFIQAGDERPTPLLIVNTKDTWLEIAKQFEELDWDKEKDS